jgi:zinc transporter ZupT
MVLVASLAYAILGQVAPDHGYGIGIAFFAGVFVIAGLTGNVVSSWHARRQRR